MVQVSEVQEVKPAQAAAPVLAPRGLEGVAVAETKIGDVRGEEGFYHYRGYDATELARHCSFEQVWHLLLVGELPGPRELRWLQDQAVAGRALPSGIAPILDEIARLKQSDALLCDAISERITTRLLSREGWEPHCPSLFHRHYIKRFYGVYPPRQGWLPAVP